MTSKFSALISVLLLGACGAATALPPNGRNPAHCIAAFSYARTIALNGRPSDINLAVQSTARSLYEGRKLKARGLLENSRGEGEALLSKHGKDEKFMMGLVLECLKQQDEDPNYRALNESGDLMAAARKVEPVCRGDATC